MKTQTTHNVTTLRPAKVGTSKRSLESQNRYTRLGDAMNTHAATQQVRNVASLATKFRNVVFLAALMVAFASVASADIVHDLTISLAFDPCDACGGDSGAGGSPATGGADFNPEGYPWTFSFITGNATAWQQIGEFYSASFNSGEIQINGPFGLVFTGTVTGGSSFSSDIIDQASVNFAGTWSNGLYGYGDALVGECVHCRGPFVDFSVTTVPEPASLALFGPGILGLAGVLRRRLMG